MDNSGQIDKQLMRESFDRAAVHYDEAAALQRMVADNIMERLEMIRINPTIILDVGTGTGYSAPALSQRYKDAQLVLLDIAPAMLHQARSKQSWLQKTFLNRQHYLCADAMSLPIADNSVDLIHSNLTIQWCEDLQQTFAEFRRVLKPNGLLMFSTFGPDTLKELRKSWQTVDEFTHVHQFVDMHDIGDILLHYGFADPVMDVDRYTLSYDDVYDLMRELKTLGAHNVAHTRPHTLTGPRRIKAMVNAYEQYRNNGKIPASYEVVFGQAWSPSSQTKPSRSTVNVDFPLR